MLMRCYWFIFVFCLSVFATATSAQPVIPGSADPEFVEAVDEWLEGNEIEALSSMSTLARMGHVPAKILLSRIADTDWLSAHIAEKLSRTERIELFREPRGLSGRDWLASASEDSELANALWATQFGEPREVPEFESIVRTLIIYGEIKPLLGYFIKTWQFGHEDVAVRAIIENDALFGAAGRDFLGFAIQSMIQRGKQPLFPSRIRTIEEMRAFLDWLRSDVHKFAASGYIRTNGTQIAIPTRRDGLELIADAAHSLRELQPLLLFCESMCAASQQRSCLADTASTIAQAGAFPYPFSSPAQSLIADEAYWSSSRFFEDVNRTLNRQGWSGCR
ncbi:hypothetical protein RA27_22215 [Ruegeria sp. ANG-R]|uniref:hypothetical protein n=1 Tax=Ruegeria sp. ANG-R TaxID=1577903 RepID=UPI00057EB207|nr:hypothetical protein [Ruegeria sp. ANG-R]KIC36468.1 hypothetical protein RA27_22215 [Ruegeria sp. ANG-R]